jgi:hypothetical protein
MPKGIYILFLIFSLSFSLFTGCIEKQYAETVCYPGVQKCENNKTLICVSNGTGYIESDSALCAEVSSEINEDAASETASEDSDE